MQTQTQLEAITLSPAQLSALIADAVARATRPQPKAWAPDALLAGPDAATYVYGREDALKAWHKLRQRHPEIDALSTGCGRLRRWRRTDLDQWLADRKSATQNP